jgi:macrolide transport system ATP-binding/permease protein
MMRALLGDVRYGIRALAKQPGFVVVAVLSLAIGIGVNTAVFSALNALLFRPPAVRDLDRTVFVYHASPDNPDRGMSFPAFQRYRDREDVFAAVMAFSGARPLVLDREGERGQVYAELVSADFFTVADINLTVGRPFDAAVDRLSPQFVAVLSHRMWHRRFASDSLVVGMTIALNGYSFEVAGVAGPEFTGLDAEVSADLWIPLTTWAHVVGEPARLTSEEHWITTLAQLRPGVSLQQAQAAMAVGGHAAQRPEERTLVRPAAERSARRNTDALAIGAGAFAVGLLVLALAGINVTNLLIARAAGRQQEMSVRMALGSGRARLIRLWLAESLVISIVAGAAGLLFAWWILDFIVTLEPPTLIGHAEAPVVPLEFDLELRVFAFAAGLSALTATAIGLVSGLQGSKPGLMASLKTGGPTDQSFAPGLNVRSAILAFQMALSLFLLIPCGLLVRGSLNASAMDPGFVSDRVLLLPISTNQSGVRVKKPAGFDQQLADRVALLRGVESVTVMDPVPLWFAGNFAFFSIETGGPPRVAERVGHSRVAPGYFQTLRLPLVRGRDFTASDTAAAPSVGIVNETLARRFWPETSAVGQRIRGRAGSIEVIGVARDAKYLSLGETRQPWLYRPLSQTPTDNPTLSLAVRTAGPPFQIRRAVEREVKALVATWPGFQFRTLDEGLELQRQLPRLAATLLGSLGAFGLLLAAMGMYAVTAYVVKQRNREIGIRLALGAPVVSVLTMIVRQGFAVCAVGAAVGLAGALATARLLRTLLHGIDAADPLSYATVTLGLVLVALLACYLPARRATRLNPLRVLRDE